MKIAAIRTCRVDLSLREGCSAWSEVKHVEVFASAAVGILTGGKWPGIVRSARSGDVVGNAMGETRWRWSRGARERQGA